MLQAAQAEGYVGPGLVEAQIVHGLAFAAAAGATPSRAADLGSGGGLPGLVLARGPWTTTQLLLIESREQRAEFLRWSVAELQLAGRVSVAAERAELAARQPDHRGRYEVVTARSFGPPGVVAECAAPLLGHGGRLVVSEPPLPSAGRWPSPGLAELGLGPAVVHAGPPRLVVIARVGLCPERYPRRPGIPGKRPVF